MHRTISALPADRRGAVLVEMALVLPLLASLLLGIVCYGRYFLVAHSVQQIANDAARVTVAGLTPAERDRLATQTAAAAAAANPEIDPADMTVAVREHGQTLSVRITFDARGEFMRFPLVPMPSSRIERSAVVLVGGIA
jgi:Flp pilus assembly protein TadG